MATMHAVNPATGEVIGRFEELSDAELEARIARAAQTFRAWRRRPFAERAALMVRAAEVLEFVNVKTVVVQELAAAAPRSATE